MWSCDLSKIWFLSIDNLTSNNWYLVLEKILKTDRMGGQLIFNYGGVMGRRVPEEDILAVCKKADVTFKSSEIKNRYTMVTAVCNKGGHTFSTRYHNLKRAAENGNNGCRECIIPSKEEILAVCKKANVTFKSYERTRVTGICNKGHTFSTRYFDLRRAAENGNNGCRECSLTSKEEILAVCKKADVTFKSSEFKNGHTLVTAVCNKGHTFSTRYFDLRRAAENGTFPDHQPHQNRSTRFASRVAGHSACQQPHAGRIAPRNRPSAPTSFSWN